MRAGDLIVFTKTGVHGLITAIHKEGRKEGFIDVLCGPDAEGNHAGETHSFPRQTIINCVEVINASR